VNYVRYIFTCIETCALRNIGKYWHKWLLKTFKNSPCGRWGAKREGEYGIFVYENRKMKSVEIVLRRRGRGEEENNGGR
jgi:hypothetical protein